MKFFNIRTKVKFSEILPAIKTSAYFSRLGFGQIEYNRKASVFWDHSKKLRDYYQFKSETSFLEEVKTGLSIKCATCGHSKSMTAMRRVHATFN